MLVSMDLPILAGRHEEFAPGIKLPLPGKPVTVTLPNGERRTGRIEAIARVSKWELRATVTVDLGDDAAVTKSGRVLLSDDFERLADEAERGYDVDEILRRRNDPTRGDFGDLVDAIFRDRLPRGEIDGRAWYATPAGRFWADNDTPVNPPKEGKR